MFLRTLGGVYPQKTSRREWRKKVILWDEIVVEDSKVFVKTKILAQTAEIPVEDKMRVNSVGGSIS